MYYFTENDSTENTTIINEYCNKYGFSVKVLNMKEYLKNNNVENKMSDCLSKNNYPSSIKYDIEKNLKRYIFLQVAKELNCRIIFTAETNTSLAKKLLSNISIGRGSQVEHDTVSNMYVYNICI